MRSFFIALGVAVAIGVIVFTVFFFRPQATISVKPATAAITIGQARGVGQGTFTLMPGTYDLVIEEKGYIPLKRSEQLSIGERFRLQVTLKPIPQTKVITTEAVSLVELSSDNKGVLYIGNGGKTLYQRTETEQRALTPDSFDTPALFRISPTQDVALVKKSNGDVVIHDFKRYDLVQQIQSFFGRDIGGIDWVYPEGNQLLYSYAPKSLTGQGGERTLVLSDRTSKENERVLNLRDAGLTDPTVSVAPDGKTAILVSRPDKNFQEYNMFLFDFFTKRAKQLTTDGSKIDARFTPSGKRILYTRFQQDPDGLVNQMVSVMDVDGKNRKDFDLRATLPQVAFLDENRLVVAASKKSGNELFRLDLVSGEVKQYYLEANGLHFSKIVLAGDGKSLFATASPNPGEKSGTLYTIRLETDEY